MKYRFLQDGCGHWYLTPTTEEPSVFEEYQVAMEDGEDWDGTNFNKYRIDSPWQYMFENPTINEEG